MNPLRRLATAALVALILTHFAVPNARAVTIDWVTVGNPGNAPQPVGEFNQYGAVNYEYQIMKFEWTNAQYVAFLNAIDPEGTNPNSVYNANMTSDSRGGISFASNGPLGLKYRPFPDMGDKPVNFVSWWDAARVANWLHNGAPQYLRSNSTAAAPHNHGAYTLGTETGGSVPSRNADARYWIPTDNEWFKAAYYNPVLNGEAGGYTLYGNGFDETPSKTSATPNGAGQAGPMRNFANYDNGAVWNGQTGNLTTVGTNGGASYYGAFDMSGNVFEWNDSGPAANFRDVRGGAYNTSLSTLTGSSLVISSPTTERSDRGFRLAAVPEPSTYAMALAGLACGGYLVRRSPRSSP